MIRSMKVRDLPEISVTKKDRFYSCYGSLTGNQRKWRLGNKFIKLNLLGYENISEVLISRFLEYTDIPEESYVKYYSCRIYEDGIYLGVGCYSYDFAENKSQFTLRSILENNLMSTTSSYDNVRDLLLDLTGKDFKKYLDTLLCLDAITFNADRHFGNIMFLEDKGNWEGIIFDNGDSCLSDLVSYPIGTNIELACNSILAKPFSEFFMEQIKYATPILVRYNDFLEDIDIRGSYVQRAFDVLKFGLEKTRGIAWEEY